MIWRATGSALATAMDLVSVRRPLATGLACLAAGLLALAVPLEVEAQTEKRLKVHWVARHREVTLDYKQASADLETAETAKRKARQQHRLKGDRRVEMNKTLDEAQNRYLAAKQALDDFPEDARRAGAMPGWFR